MENLMARLEEIPNRVQSWKKSAARCELVHTHGLKSITMVYFFSSALSKPRKVVLPDPQSPAMPSAKLSFFNLDFTILLATEDTYDSHPDTNPSACGSTKPTSSILPIASARFFFSRSASFRHACYSLSQKYLLTPREAAQTATSDYCLLPMSQCQ